MSQPGASSKPRVLVAPLDWGLGHATRCIPVIKELLHQNCDVLIAGEGNINLLLKNEFSELTFIDLPGYRIKYTKNSRMLALGILSQVPKILSAIKKENQWLKKVMKEYSIDAVVSDNRYGLHHSKIPSVFITHQLLIKAPLKRLENYLQKLNYDYIDNFSECWVPDVEGENNLAGELSHPLKKPNVPLKYVSALSRFSNNEHHSEEKHLLILLSGPEPQRTVFERLIVDQLEQYKQPVVLVRGLPGEKNVLHLSSNIEVFNHLPAEELQQKMLQASFIISRCGYSTVMDIAALKKKSILIPTPGQTEQEYLAKHLTKSNFALCIEQKKLRLETALELASLFNYRINNYDKKTALAETIRNFITRIKDERIKHSSLPVAHPANPL